MFQYYIILILSVSSSFSAPISSLTSRQYSPFECTDPAKPWKCWNYQGENCHPQPSGNVTCCTGNTGPSIICQASTPYCGFTLAHPSVYPTCYPCPQLDQGALDPKTGQCVDLTKPDNCGAIGATCSSSQTCKAICPIHASCTYKCVERDPCANNPCQNSTWQNCIPSSYPTCTENCYYCQGFPALPNVTCPKTGPPYPHLPVDPVYLDTCSQPQAAVPPGVPPLATTFKVLKDYYSESYTLVALATDGNVACISTNSVDCMWGNFTCMDTIRQNMGTMYTNTVFFECGDIHYQFWNSSGYSQPNHWCRRGWELLRPGVAIPDYPC